MALLASIALAAVAKTTLPITFNESLHGQFGVVDTILAILLVLEVDALALRPVNDGIVITPNYA